MKKYSLVLFLIMSIASCSHKPENTDYPDESIPEEKFDSTPVDSFSHGATSVDVARKIKMASQSYQDSLKKALITAEAKKQDAQQKEKLKKDAEKLLKDKTVSQQSENKTDNDKKTDETK